ncbi:ANTAR domain-containing protein, partial [Faecalibaculum rodentium]
DKFDQAAYTVRETSVFVLSMPVNRQAAWQAVAVVEKARLKIRQVERQLARTRDKYKELQVVSRCKLLLMENYQWTEEKAHRYIEKTAMDHSTTKVLVARILLDKMQARA